MLSDRRSLHRSDQWHCANEHNTASIGRLDHKSSYHEWANCFPIGLFHCPEQLLSIRGNPFSLPELTRLPQCLFDMSVRKHGMFQLSRWSERRYDIGVGLCGSDATRCYWNGS